MLVADQGFPRGRQFPRRVCQRVVTACKRSLGQGNIFFTGVCQEFCSQGGGAWSWGAVPGPRGCLVLGGMPGPGVCVCVWRPPPGRVLLRMVRILLEFILVLQIFLAETACK